MMTFLDKSVIFLLGFATGWATVLVGVGVMRFYKVLN